MTDAVRKKQRRPVVLGPFHWIVAVACCMAANAVPFSHTLDRACGIHVSTSFGNGWSGDVYGFCWTVTHLFVVAGSFGVAMLLPLLWNERPRSNSDRWFAVASVSIPGLLLTLAEPMLA